jgi:putative ABC transport system substrate-binding protein
VSGLTRRRFVQGAGVAGLGVLAGCGRLPGQAPPPKVARIGVLVPYPADSRASQDVLEPLRAGLQEMGYLEGQNVVLEYRFAEGQNDRLPGLAAELVRLPLDLIVAEKHEATVAAKQATTTLPIVVSMHADPVGLGVVASLARPGGNVTGLSNTAANLAAKKIELLQQVSPGISRVVMFSDFSRTGGAQRQIREAEVSAKALGLELLSLDVRSPADFTAAFDTAVRAGADALQAFSDPLTVSQMDRVVDFAARNRIVAIYNERAWVDAGGLMFYGPNYAAIYRRTAYYVDRILKGAKPAELPIEQPTTFDFVINLRAAQALGLTIPQHVILQATEVSQ